MNTTAVVVAFLFVAGLLYVFYQNRYESKDGFCQGDPKHGHEGAQGHHAPHHDSHESGNEHGNGHKEHSCGCLAQGDSARCICTASGPGGRGRVCQGNQRASYAAGATEFSNFAAIQKAHGGPHWKNVDPGQYDYPVASPACNRVANMAPDAAGPMPESR